MYQFFKDMKRTWKFCFKMTYILNFYIFLSIFLYKQWSFLPNILLAKLTNLDTDKFYSFSINWYFCCFRISFFKKLSLFLIFLRERERERERERKRERESFIPNRHNPTRVKTREKFIFDPFVNVSSFNLSLNFVISRFKIIINTELILIERMRLFLIALLWNHTRVNIRPSTQGHSHPGQWPLYPIGLYKHTVSWFFFRKGT